MDDEKLMNEEIEKKDLVLPSHKLEYKFVDASTIEEADQLELESSDSATEYEEDPDELVDWDKEAQDDQADLEGAMEEFVVEIPMAREPIGTKDTRKQVGDVKKAPYRWICSLQSFFRDPDDPNIVVPLEGGTGLLIGPNHVLTAAHTVYAEITGSRGTVRKQKALRTRVYVGRNGSDSSAIVRANSHSYAYPEAFTKDLDPRWDYAIIKLKKKIGLKRFRRINNQVLGYWGSTKWGQNTKMQALSTNYLRTQIVNVGGYPKNKSGLQYLAYDSVKEVPANFNGTPIRQLITYLVDTSPGQSGAPVWKYIKSSGKRYLVAVHHGPCNGKWNGCVKSGKVSFNIGVLITTKVLQQIRTWVRTM